MTRDCKTCIHSEIGHGEGNGCTAWNCEYVNKWEALDVYKHYKNVVRCKNCKHYESDGGALMQCGVSGITVNDEDYCSYGERREE